MPATRSRSPRQRRPCPHCRALCTSSPPKRIFLEARCGICLETKRPLLALPCGHAFCDDCAEAIGWRATPPPAAQSAQRATLSDKVEELETEWRRANATLLNELANQRGDRTAVLGSEVGWRA